MIKTTKKSIGTIILSLLMLINLFSVSAFAGTNTWSKQIEAETGVLTGISRTEAVAGIGISGEIVGWLDDTEDNSVTISFTPEFTGTAKMTIRYRSGETRDLMYRVNGGEAVRIIGLNSGSWNALKTDDSQIVSLMGGVENKLKFFGPEGAPGPGLDWVKLDMEDGVPALDRTALIEIIDKAEAEINSEIYTEDSVALLREIIATAKTVLNSINATESEIAEQVTKVQEGIDGLVEGSLERIINFYINKNSIGSEPYKIVNTTWGSIIDAPTEPTDGDLRFIGWFINENNKETQIKFPYTVKKNVDIFAKWAGDTPANPVEKDGYRLIFDEEFDGNTLDENLWVDKYLASWTKTPERSNPTYELKDGIMNLQIQEETQPWCPEYDGETVVSGFTTAHRNGLHNWTGNNKIRNPSDMEVTHINKYGYYEIRSKGQAGSSRHVAWWLTGLEDVPNESCEIDIFEILGNNPNAVPVAFHKWKDPTGPDGGSFTYTNKDKNFHDEYHVFGFDWIEGAGSGSTPDKMVLYVDGEQIGEKNVKIDYPLIQLFSIYEKRGGGWTGPWEPMPYPNTFAIDYVRVYKKLPEGQTPIADKDLKITHVQDSKLELPTEETISLKTYTSQVVGHEGEIYTEKTLTGTKSYVDVTFNDGVVTQEYVKWDAITEDDLAKLNSGKTVIKKGTLANLPPDMPGLVQPNLIVNEKELILEQAIETAREVLTNGNSTAQQIVDVMSDLSNAIQNYGKK